MIDRLGLGFAVPHVRRQPAADDAVITVARLIRMIASLTRSPLTSMRTKAGPGAATKTISFYVDRCGFRFLDIGQTAAFSFILLIVFTILTWVPQRTMREA